MMKMQMLWDIFFSMTIFNSQRLNDTTIFNTHYFSGIQLGKKGLELLHQATTEVPMVLLLYMT